jgi:acyl transferase domain-containing protein
VPFAPDVPARAAVSAFGFGGNNFHAVLEEKPRATAVRRPARKIDDDAIAIVGMGGMFPTGGNVEEFWRSLLEGADATREVPKDRWDIDRHYDADPTRKDTSYTKLGCFLDTLPPPSVTMGIPPSAFQSLDPSQVLTLLAAEEALRDVGKAAVDAWDKARVSVQLAFLPYQGRKFLADIRVNFREYEEDLRKALVRVGLPMGSIDDVVAETEERFKRDLPAITEDTLTGYLGSLNAARVTRLHDFHGPHFVVDSACASTHCALHAAMTSLRHKTADVAIAGGVWCEMMPEFFVAACRFNALSATGSTPFDKRADGFIPGEGAGVFVLRRLRDADEHHGAKPVHSD